MLFEMTPQENQAVTITVWDASVRISHWALAVFFFLAYFTGEDEGFIFRVHLYVGYLILLIVVYRLAWGLIGSEHARFVNFIRPWPDVKNHLKSVLRFSPAAYIGHNPTGGWMIVLMLFTLILIAITGMMAAVGEGVTVPFFGWLPKFAAKAAEEVHEVAANAMMIMVGIHVIGVLAESLLSGENLIRSMINGQKFRPIGTSEGSRVGAWQAIFLAIIIAAFGVYLVARSRY